MSSPRANIDPAPPLTLRERAEGARAGFLASGPEPLDFISALVLSRAPGRGLDEVGGAWAASLLRACEDVWIERPKDPGARLGPQPGLEAVIQEFARAIGPAADALREDPREAQDALEWVIGAGQLLDSRLGLARDWVQMSLARHFRGLSENGMQGYGALRLGDLTHLDESEREKERERRMALPGARALPPTLPRGFAAALFEGLLLAREGPQLAAPSQDPGASRESDAESERAGVKRLPRI